MSKPREMTIEFDHDCMDPDTQQNLEEKLLELLLTYGWYIWASGADCVYDPEDRTHTRDIALRYCVDFDCEHWDGHSGCEAPKTRCIKETTEMPEITWQDIMEAVARGWASKDNEHKERDVILAEAITQQVADLFKVTTYRTEEV